MMRSVSLAAVILAFGLADAATAQTTHVVEVFSNFYSPKDISIQPGDSVRWDWKGGFHTVTSGNGSACSNSGVLFDAPSDFANTTFTFTFNEAGKFDYYCLPHEFLNMFGSVSVSALSINGTPSAGNPVSFTVANLPASDEGGRALVLLSITGTSPGIAVPGGPCAGTIDIRFDPITQLGLSLAPFLTTGVITGGTASTFAIPLPGNTPAGLTVFFGGIVTNGGAFGSILPTEQVVTQ